MPEQQPDNQLTTCQTGTPARPSAPISARDETHVQAVRAQVEAGEYEVPALLLADRLIDLARSRAPLVAKRRTDTALTPPSRPAGAG
jgi:anti-sigma28 factor (negative regulator of flagellin synthesis)